MHDLASGSVMRTDMKGYVADSGTSGEKCLGNAIPVREMEQGRSRGRNRRSHPALTCVSRRRGPGWCAVVAERSIARAERMGPLDGAVEASRDFLRPRNLVTKRVPAGLPRSR